jgi:hypothetical protein
LKGEIRLVANLLCGGGIGLPLSLEHAVSPTDSKPPKSSVAVVAATLNVAEPTALLNTGIMSVTTIATPGPTLARLFALISRRSRKTAMQAPADLVS